MYKITYTDTSVSDLEWFGKYYSSVFPEGRVGARKKFLQAEKYLQNHPHIWYSLKQKWLKKLQIPKTHFSFIYTVVEHEIFIVRILDDRKGIHLFNK